MLIAQVHTICMPLQNKTNFLKFALVVINEHLLPCFGIHMWCRVDE